MLITTDTDFGTILALSGRAHPSVLLLRGVGDSVQQRLTAILRALPLVHDDLEQGAIAVVEDERIRLRHLPVED